jgi:hypothetical protein
MMYVLRARSSFAVWAAASIDKHTSSATGAAVKSTCGREFQKVQRGRGTGFFVIFSAWRCLHRIVSCRLCSCVLRSKKMATTDQDRRRNQRNISPASEGTPEQRSQSGDSKGLQSGLLRSK